MNTADGTSAGKILFVHDTLDSRAGGAVEVLYNLVRGLDRDRFSPELAAPFREGELPEPFSALDLRIHQLPPLVMPPRRSLAALVKTGLALLRLNWALHRLLARERFELVYVNSTFSLHFALLPSVLRGLPVVYHEHGLPRAAEGSVWSWFFPQLVRRTTHVITIASTIRTELEELGVPAARTTTVHNGIDADRLIERGPEGARPSGAFAIVQIANLLRWKGHETVIHCLPGLVGELPGVSLTCFGHESDAEHAQGMRELARELGVGDRIEFAGFRPDVDARLPEFDCLVVASDAEPFGLVVLEAMRAGVPVVATDAGGIKEIVTHDHDGLLFPPGDVNALSLQLLRLAGDAELRENLVTNGFETLRQRFSIASQLRGVEAVLERVISETSAS